MMQDMEKDIKKKLLDKIISEMQADELGGIPGMLGDDMVKIKEVKEESVPAEKVGDVLSQKINSAMKDSDDEDDEEYGYELDADEGDEYEGVDLEAEEKELEAKLEMIRKKRAKMGM